MPEAARITGLMTANSTTSTSLISKRAAPATGIIQYFGPPLILVASIGTACNVQPQTAALFHPPSRPSIQAPSTAHASLTVRQIAIDPRLERDYRTALASEPVRDGYTHPAAVILETYFARSANAPLAVEALLKNTALQSNFVADTIRLLAQFRPATPDWRARIVAAGLASPSAVVRDAAIQAVEHWDEPLLIALLHGHKEPEPWLAAYQVKLLPLLTS
jgi:hypothetical protein